MMTFASIPLGRTFPSPRCLLVRPPPLQPSSPLLPLHFYSHHTPSHIIPPNHLPIPYRYPSYTFFKIYPVFVVTNYFASYPAKWICFVTSNNLEPLTTNTIMYPIHPPSDLVSYHLRCYGYSGIIATGRRDAGGISQHGGPHPELEETPHKVRTPRMHRQTTHPPSSNILLCHGPLHCQEALLLVILNVFRGFAK